MTEQLSNEIDVRLRPVEMHDLGVFFEHQLDPEANRMAAFTVEDPNDREGFDAHWERILTNEEITARTVIFAGEVAGHVTGFPRFGKAEVSYWIGARFWGRGVATRALTLLLAELPERPLFARAAVDNLASIRVLEKCGFKPWGHDRGFAYARGRDIDEVVLQLASEE